MIREQFGTPTPLDHRRHYNSHGKLFNVRLGTDGSAINDDPNSAQRTGASWSRGALEYDTYDTSACGYTPGVFGQRFSFDFAMRMAPKTGVF